MRRVSSALTRPVPTRNFTHREFAFTLRSEVYLRYQSFNTWEDFKKETVRLNPARFEIGPVYSGKPKDRKALLKSAFRPQLRELVFDIDMTDYDSIRTCCQDKAMCVRCWKFIAMAVKVLDRTLRGTSSRSEIHLTRRQTTLASRISSGSTRGVEESTSGFQTRRRSRSRTTSDARSSTISR